MIARVCLRALSGIVLACVVGVTAAACGSSGSSSSPSTTAPATPAAATTQASSAAAAQVAVDWVAFFSAKTPAAKRVSLLQDGSQFAAIIKAQAGSGLAAQASAKVSKVTVVSPTSARVSYSILEGGQPALQNQSGVAVYQNGTWKVGVASFCGLLVLENNGSTASLPAACKVAS
jgi:hypothetical protein